jgi:penicillin-binding protein 2
MSKNPFKNDFTENLLELKKTKVKQAESWSISLTPGWLSKSRLTVKEKRSSLAGLVAFVSLIFVIFVLQLTSLQLVKGQQFANRADGNRIRDNVTFAPRGKIIDRNGKILADNSASFQLAVSPYLLPRKESERQNQYQQISAITKTSVKDIKNITESQGLDSILPILVDGKLSQEEAIKIDLILPKLTGFSLDTIPVRKYKKDAALGTILGYVGRASESDVKSREDILPIDFVGQAGIEQFYDSTLRGINGGKRTEVDAEGRPIRVLANNPSKPGKDLKLSIDLDLQKNLESKLQQQMDLSGGKVASAVVINPKTGEVLAMVSLPSYDNNIFAGGISESDFKKFTSDPSTPLFNRAISSGYPTGSSTKPLVASAALQEKVITEDTVIVDQGKITLVNKYNPADAISFSNFEGGVNGPIKIRQAIAKSSNVFFLYSGGW